MRKKWAENEEGWEGREEQEKNKREKETEWVRERKSTKENIIFIALLCGSVLFYVGENSREKNEKYNQDWQKRWKIDVILYS